MPATPRPGPRPRRRGPGCLVSLIALVVLGVMFVAAVDFVFAPWIYQVGGRTRLLPAWQGTAVVLGPGGAYALYVWFSPIGHSHKLLPSADVQGDGFVCTPRGKRYSLYITGGASGRIWRDMDGHEFDLSLRHRPVGWSFTPSNHWRPRLSLSGRWVGPNLVMNDDGSFARAFLPSGELNTAEAGWAPKSAGAPVILTERRSWWPLSPGCDAIGR